MNQPTESFEPPCDKCGGKCCHYVAIEVGKPTTKRDYDHIRWYLNHKNVNIFIDHDRKWYVEFRTPCVDQLENHRCGIYSRRPQICRNHGNTEGECEFYDLPFYQYFQTREEFEQYLKKKGIDWKYKGLSN